MKTNTGSFSVKLWLLATLLLVGLALSACDLLAPPAPPLLETDTPLPPAETSQSAVPKVTPTPPLARSATPGVSPTSAPVTPALSPTASQTAIPGSPTLSPTITQTGTRTRTATITPWWTPLPTRTSTVTLTPTPQPPYLRFMRPGAYSRVRSPIQLEAGVTPGEDGLVSIDLIGEDGRTISRQRLNYSEYLNRSIAISPKIDFSIPSVAETARLVISVQDRFGRKIALSSLDLVLFSIGDNDFYPASEQIAPFILRAPFADQVVQGGVLRISGLARPINNNPLIFELVNEQNQVINTAALNIPMPSGALSHNPFGLDLGYSVKTQVRARLVVRQESANRIPGTVALWSVPVLLQP